MTNSAARTVPALFPQSAEEELPALLVKHGAFVYVPVMIAATLIAWMAYSHAPLWIVLWWIISMAAALCFREWANRFAAQQIHRPISTRMKVILIACAIEGLVMGQTAIWQHIDGPSQIIHSIFVLALCSGSVVSEYGHPRAFTAFLLPCLCQFTIYMADTLTPNGAPALSNAAIVAVSMLVLFGAVMFFLAQNTFRMFQNSFDARQRLHVALQEAEAANRAKTRFLASASHDLRQPMNTLSLFSAALSMRRLDPATMRVVTQMNKAVAALSSQMDALLDVSKLDAGVVSVKQCSFDLVPFVLRLLHDLEPEARRKQLQLVHRLPAQGVVHTDPLLLERVLRNLLDNAVKYTLHGAIHLSVEVSDGYFLVCINDTGPGIPAAEQELVFDEFYQVANPERDRTQGLGLGLAIVRRLSKMLQLDLQMQSLEGHGTSFTLKVAQGRLSDKDEMDDSVPNYIVQGLRLLIIDDEASVREAMQTLLESLGAEVFVASGTEEATLVATQQTLDMVLADFRLRGSDSGLTAVAKLRSLQPNLAAVLVSGDTAPERLREAHAAGMQLLHKPVALDALKRAIREELIDIPKNHDSPHRSS